MDIKTNVRGNKSLKSFKTIKTIAKDGNIEIKRKFGSKKVEMSRSVQPEAKVVKDANDINPPKEEKVKPPKFSAKFSKKPLEKEEPSTFRYFICSKCRLVYRVDMKVGGGRKRCENGN